MDFLLQDFAQAPFWIAVAQIIGVNVVLSGDNAVVIAMACMTLPARQRLWGMVLGAGVAVLLRVLFTLVVAQAMTYPYLKLIGGVLLFWVATKLVSDDGDGGEEGVEAARTLWRAVRIVAIADIVMSLDNVIAIAASAEIAAARVNLAHAAEIKATLIIFGLATSVPLIIAGSAVLMSLLQRYRALVWAGGALLGWVAGDIMTSDPGLAGWLSDPVLHQLHAWGGRVGGVLVVGVGYGLIAQRRRLLMDEMVAGVGLLIWIAGDIFNEYLFGGVHPNLVMIWSTRAVLLVVLIVGYVALRSYRQYGTREV